MMFPRRMFASEAIADHPQSGAFRAFAARPAPGRLCACGGKRSDSCKVHAPLLLPAFSKMRRRVVDPPGDRLAAVVAAEWMRPRSGRCAAQLPVMFTPLTDSADLLT